jgi:hypothetical protein
MSKRIIGWLLNQIDRDGLLAAVAPTHPQVIAHHVTLKVGTTDPPPADAEGTIVGVADDGEGVQALVVRIGGTTDRPGGGTYHITWSLGSGRRPVESNHVIAEHGWTALADPRPVRLKGAVL